VGGESGSDQEIYHENTAKVSAKCILQCVPTAEKVWGGIVVQGERPSYLLGRWRGFSYMRHTVKTLLAFVTPERIIIIIYHILVDSQVEKKGGVN